MIRLGIKRDPRTLDLGQGVQVTVKPLTYAIYRAAVMSAQRSAVQVAYEAGMIEQAGGIISDIPDVHDRDGIIGLSEQFLLQSLAKHAITAWSGVGDENGVPLTDVEPHHVESLIRDHPTIASRFERKYLADLEEQIAEGNGSGAAPSGTSEAAPSTVAGAVSRDSLAPMEGATPSANTANTESTNP